MPQTGANSTPQPYRQNAESFPFLRHSFESELWDDLANAVYGANYEDVLAVGANNAGFTIGSLTIPCPVAARLQIECRTQATVPNGVGPFVVISTDYSTNGAAAIAIVPGQGYASAAAIGIMFIPITCTNFIDVPAGINVIRFRATTGPIAGTDFVRNTMLIRRGRMPVN